MLLDQLALDPIYWRAVLKYCAAGGLQSALDEYMHHLRSAMSDLPLDDEALVKIAEEMSGALTLRPSTYRASINPYNPDASIPLHSRFALRYGGRGDSAGGSPATRGS